MGATGVASLILNIAIALGTVGSWLQMSLGKARDSAQLTLRGWRNLKYFTVLSNLFSGLVCMGYLGVLLALRTTPTWMLVLKLVATTAVMLTFVTVIAILAPRFGWKSMYEGGNLWMHGVLPALAAVDCCLFVPVRTLPLWVTVLGVLPTMLYGLFYLARVIRYGAEKDGVVYDFYGFTRWGTNKIPLVCIVMMLVSWFIALLLYVL